ncbi:hypothetical protein MKX03_030479 [Papaver bracteatum]|nr:hypothetical protein MKX03_030479 [Papaver bracteatum]
MEPRRSKREPKPVLKQEEIERTDEAIDDALSRKRKGKMKMEEGSTSSQGNKKQKKSCSTGGKKKKEEIVKMIAEETEFCKLMGEPVPEAEARSRWPERYDEELIAKKLAEKKIDEEVLMVESHYLSAEVDEITYDLYENALVKSDKEETPYICRILEFFRTKEGHVYFTAQWFYRPSDTVMGAGPKQSDLIRQKCVFFSDVKNDNPLECLVGKANVSIIPGDVELARKEAIIASSDYYTDMFYKLPYCGFISIPPGYTAEATIDGRDASSGLSSAIDSATGGGKVGSTSSYTPGQSSKTELSLLDLYAGCGAMSTGLCLGAKVGDVNLVTRWALDLNESACQSLSLNHPETKVTNDCGENFLSLLREWEKLCQQYSLVGGASSDYVEDDSEDREDSEVLSPEELEVDEIIGISFGDPTELAKAKKSKGKGSKKGVTIPKGTELYFKVHWKGFDSSEDTWEPRRNLSNCEEKIRKFVTTGYQSNILPLPGDVDVICGGPPCQGISGFNQHRNVKKPLADEKNYQMVVYLDIIEFLKPSYILMENVVDLLQFSQGFLARYALSRLVSMGYQVRLGIMAAGSFGLPQFRQRVFLWGAQVGKKLPPYPLPTHECVVRYGVPTEFEGCLVAYDESVTLDLKKPLFLVDALRDLPGVENGENRDTIDYVLDPENDFQRYIRMSRTGEGLNASLYDHIPLELNTHDYQRVCRVPREKGAFFFHLGGVIKGEDDKWDWDPNSPREYLAPEKPLVPDYAMTFNGGKSDKPFARLWWDETVSTVVTRAEPHNQAMIHPIQDRVLSVRENARLQGFFDYYQLCGEVRDKYTQVGNAVAIPVAKALGYALSLAVRGLCGDEPLIELPDNFTFTIQPIPFPVVEPENRAVEEH